MAKIYNIKANQDIKALSYCTFDNQKSELENPTYSEVLNILKKAFNLVDMPFLVNKTK